MIRLIKPDPQVDFYAVFCTITDDFLTRIPCVSWKDGEYLKPAFDLADEFGSSENLPPGEDREYGWDCKRFLLHRGTGTAWWLDRSDIQEYVRRKTERECVDQLLELITEDG